MLQISTSSAGEEWWAMTDSNRRHPRCKRGALPTELIARRVGGGDLFAISTNRKRGPPIFLIFFVTGGADTQFMPLPYHALANFHPESMHKQSPRNFHAHNKQPRCVANGVFSVSYKALKYVKSCKRGLCEWRPEKIAALVIFCFQIRLTLPCIPLRQPLNGLRRRRWFV
jgi:hypothetical protein